MGRIHIGRGGLVLSLKIPHLFSVTFITRRNYWAGENWSREVRVPHNEDPAIFGLRPTTYKNKLNKVNIGQQILYQIPIFKDGKGTRTV